MTDRPDQKPSLADLRDELGDEFMRVARDEPRSRLRRRLRYLGVPVVCALLVVPAAVAISGSTDGRDPDGSTRALVGRDCLEPPGARPLLRGGEAYAIPAPPPLEALRRRGMAARDLRDFLGVEARLPEACPIAVPMRAPGLNAVAPLINERPGRGEPACVSMLAPQQRDGRVAAARCVKARDKALQAAAPAALRADCLTITAGQGGALEARVCDRETALAPRVRPTPLP